MPNAIVARRGSSRRLAIYAGALVLALGVLAAQRVRQRLAIAHTHTVDGLVDRLAEGGDDGWDARDELLPKVGAGNVQFWSRLLDSPDAHTRCVAADVLGDMGSAGAVRALTGALTDSYSATRIIAIDGLARAGPEVALRPLLAGLRDHDSDLRRSAVLQLGRLRDKRAVPGLVRALRSPDRLTAQSAAYALRRITGEPIRLARVTAAVQAESGVRKWERWWAAARPTWPIDAALADVPPIEPTRATEAPDLGVRAVAGDMIQLSELRGKVVLVSFWGTWCGECMGEMPLIESFAHAYAPRGVAVVGLAVGEQGPQAVRAFARDRHITFPLALASLGICDAWGHVHEVPVEFMVDRRGRIRYQWDGARDASTFVAAADRLLAEP